MHRIYPLESAAIELAERYKQYLEEGGYPLHRMKFVLEERQSPIIIEHPPKVKEWHALLLAVVDDQFNSLMRWAEPSHKEESLLRQILPIYGDKASGLLPSKPYEQVSEAFDRFYSEVYDPVLTKINDWLDDLIGDDPEDYWRIWHIRQMGRDILIERGIDYRVYEWQRQRKDARKRT